MVVGASYALAHDHDDHDDHDDHEDYAAEFGGECMVCSVAALGAAKISPDVQSVTKPVTLRVQTRSRIHFLIADRFSATLNPARGPPVSIPSF